MNIPDIKTAVESFTDCRASTKEVMQRMVAFYDQAVADVAEINSLRDCVEYMNALDSISQSLEDIARKDNYAYRYFLYGVFQGQIGAMRHTLLHRG